MAIQNVTHGSVTFPFDIGANPTYTTGTYVDGVPYIVVPSGSITLNEPTPVQTVSGGTRTINGSMKNPYQEANPFDSQISTNFNGALAPTYPLSLTAGDCVVKVKSLDPATITRNGVIEQWACIHVVASAPGANDFSPPPFWTTSFGSRPTLTCDVDALVATMPSLSTSGMTMPTWTEVSWFYDRFNPGYCCAFADNSIGFEAALQYSSGYNSGGARNYGRAMASVASAAMALLLSDAATTNEKKAIAKRIIQRGAHFFFSKYSAGDVDAGGGGAQHQFHIAEVPLALKWSGHSDKIKLMMTYTRGNLSQCYYIDQAYLDAMTPHSSASLPQYSRLKAVETAWDGTYIWTNRNSEDTNLVYTGLKLVRQSDGAFATITSFDNVGSQWKFGLAADLSPASQIGDQLYCAHPAVWTPTIGTPEWGADPGLSSTDSNNNPSNVTGYRGLNRWAMQIMAISYFGVVHPTMQAAVDYVERANTANTPDATFDMPDHFDSFESSTGTNYGTFQQAFWNAHWATCKAQPRSVTFADSFTVTNS